MLIDLIFYLVALRRTVDQNNGDNDDDHDDDNDNTCTMMIAR